MVAHESLVRLGKLKLAGGADGAGMLVIVADKMTKN